jgi:imidazolonepropionase-like amidohydrolase
MRAARDAGVKIALGSEGTPALTSVEVTWMVHHGLSPKEVLVAATKTAAEALDIDKWVGTVEQGKRHHQGCLGSYASVRSSAARK